MRSLFILRCLVAAICGRTIASEDYRPGMHGVRDVPGADAYVGPGGTVTDWVPDSSR